MRSYDERMKSILHKTTEKKKRNTWITLGTAMACTAALLLILFVPYSTTPPSVRQYAGSEYYELIQKLNEYTYEKPRYKNNFQALIGQLTIQMKDYSNGMLAVPGDAMNGAPVQDDVGIPEFIPSDKGEPNAGNGSYEEVTDNQVSGVIEADIFKRSDKYIYHLYGNMLRVYSIAQDASVCVGEYGFPNLIGVRHEKEDLYLYTQDMFLSRDCTTVTVRMGGSYGSRGIFKDIIVFVNLDVTDPKNICETGRILFAGSNAQTRLVDGDILLTYNVGGYKNTINFADEKTFVPQYGWVDDLQYISMKDIVLPERADNGQYTVVCKLDGKTLESKGIKALLSYSQNVYVSADKIFVTHGYSQDVDESKYGVYTSKQLTEITGISYAGDALEVLGSICVEGRVKDQYSMDEYEGVFRVVSTNVERKVEVSIGSTHYYPATTNVSLYCIDLTRWEAIGKVEAFAPQGEELTSARFDGVHAYVCTAKVIQLTDPVYFFDLSDPKHITYTDTGTIDGYSTSLIQFGNGNLVGIGYNDSRELKIEVYREGNGKVQSVYSYERCASFSQEYKSYFIDREKQLIGLAIRDFDKVYDQSHKYLLLHFDGYELRVLGEYEITDSFPSGSVRADIIDGWLYLLTSYLTVYPVEV